MEYDILVVGSGLFGLTIAELCARELGLNVKIIESRNHIGGNAYSEVDDATGIEIHRYGAHLFHTSNERVWQYVNKFTSFTSYQHRVFTNFRGEIFPLPINLGTINQYLRAALSPTAAREWVQTNAAEVSFEPANLEEKAISLIGRPLYEAFIKGYTAKQWQTPPTELGPDVIARLPVRYTYDNRYFADKYEGLPIDGYTPWFERMVSDRRIDIQLSTDFFDYDQPWNARDVASAMPVVYTGPLDKYFNWSLGRLGWRTLDFEFERLDLSDYQGAPVVNYADSEVAYTRILEFKHFHPERNYAGDRTIIAREFSRSAGAEDEPYYPINTPSDRTLVKGYREMARKIPNTLFGGRLGTYQYLDMHMAIASAMTLFETKIEPAFRAGAAVGNGFAT